MNRLNKITRSMPVGTIIITACITIVVVLALLLVLISYTSFNMGFGEAVNTQTRELSAQIVYNYENYIGSIIETSNTIQTDMDKYDMTSSDDTEKFSDFLSEVVHLKGDIVKASVYDSETQQCIASSEPAEIGMGFNAIDMGWYLEAASDPTVHVFSVPYSESEDEDYKVNVSKRIKYQNGSMSGVLKIEISFQSFIDLVEKSNLGENGHITIIDPDYKIVYTSRQGEDSEQKEVDVVREIVLGSKNEVLNEHAMSVNVDTLSGTKWRICTFINVDKLTEIEHSFLSTTILVTLAVLIVAVLLYYFVARTITSPMKQLEDAMKKVEQSDYFRLENVDISASKEVEALTKRFNRMMQKISELMKRVIAEQDAQRKSELKALQNQINPHFLYNTLDSIVWLIENEKNKEAGEMVVALARLFRIGISNDSEVIPVRDEIEHVRNYLLIQKTRYADAFEYEFDIDGEALDVSTMKLVLQPIVENSIYHGLKSKVDKGYIKISVFIENGYLNLAVADNGYGMRQETIDTLYASFQDGVVSNSVGLKNIYQRVMIYYGGDAEMRIESELDEGTTITIREPLNRYEKENT